MLLSFNKGLGKLVASPAYPGLLKSVEWKRGDALTLELRFYSSAQSLVTLALEVGYEMRFAVKASFLEAADTLALASVWTIVTTGDDICYRAALNLNGEDLKTLLGDAATLLLKGELTYTEDGANWTSSQTLAVTIDNDVIKGGEGAPSSLPDVEDWLTARAVRFDIIQALEAGEQLRARNNLGLAPYNAGDISEGFTADLNNGSIQYGILTNDTTINPPINGSEGKTLDICFYTSGGDWKLYFGSNVQPVSLSSDSRYFDLVNNRSYIIKMQRVGYYWTVLSINGPTLVD